MEEKLVLLSLNESETMILMKALVKENIYTGAFDEDLKALIHKISDKASEFNIK